ncbi:MAG: DMT family transporter [Bifidobacteriaceae bacterium]|nr:DMT family transporter [Bifidobacteriaceae bacterium]
MPSPAQNQRAAGFAAIAATAVLWGTTGTAATFAPEAGPLAIGAAASGIGGLLQAAIAWPALRRAAPDLKREGRLVALGALTVWVYPLAFYTSMRLAGVAVGTVVSLASAPLASGLIERLAERRRLGRRWGWAAALGGAGAALLCLAPSAAPTPQGGLAAGLGAGLGPGGGLGLGVGLGLAAGASYALYTWVAGQLMRRGVARGAAMGAVFGGGGLLLMPVLAATGAPLLAGPRPAAVAAYMALVPMLAGYLLFGYGLARLPASTATVITLAEPAVATVLAVAVVGERLAGAGWAGMGLIAAALALLARAPADP